MNGSFKSCCTINHSASEFTGNKHFNSLDEWLTSDYLQYLKQNLTDGNCIAECNSCWSKENAGLRSIRQNLNSEATDHIPLDQSWINFYFKNKQNFDHDFFVSADVKLSNVCNFSCAMCIPNDSSRIHAAWKKSADHPLVQEILDSNPNYFEDIDLIYRDGKNYELLKDVLNSKPKNLKLLGGEPLLDPVLFQILQDYDNKSFTNLIIITNGSIDLESKYKKLKEFKSVNFVVSLEGVGSVQDYIRRGSVWKQIESNIINFSNKFGSDNIFITTTLQCLSITHLPKLLEWTYERNISLAVVLLNEPDYMSLNTIPPKLFNKLCKEFKKQDFVLTSCDQDEMSEVVTLSKLADLLQENYSYNANLLPRLKMFLDWYDPDQKWKRILPEWLPYLD